MSRQDDFERETERLLVYFKLADKMTTADFNEFRTDIIQLQRTAYQSGKWDVIEQEGAEEC